MAYTIEELIEMKNDPSISNEEFGKILEEALEADLVEMQAKYNERVTGKLNSNEIHSDGFQKSCNHFKEYKGNYLRRPLNSETDSS